MISITRKERPVPPPPPPPIIEKVIVLELDELTAKAVKLGLAASTHSLGGSFSFNSEGLELARQVKNALSGAGVYYDDKRIASF